MLLDESIRDKQSSEDDNGETCSSSSTEVQGTLNLTQSADLIRSVCWYPASFYLFIFTAGDLGQHVAEMEREFSYDLLGNDLEGKYWSYSIFSYPTFLNEWKWWSN